MDFVFTQAHILALLANAIAGVLDGCKVRLGKADVSVTPDRPLADYTIANFDGYANAAVTWSDPTISDDGEVEVIGNVPEFRPTGTVTPNEIYTVHLVDSAGTELHASKRLENAPIPMGAVTDAYQPILRYRPRTGMLSVDVT